MTTETAPQTPGQVIRSPLFYEFILWVLTKGREKIFRQFVIDLLDLKRGESVLDVGCGTGTQAFLVKENIGDAGRVFGMEPSLEMVKYARRKANRRGLAVEIQPGVIEHLEYPAQSFDVIL